MDYTVNKDGVEWASAYMGAAVKEGDMIVASLEKEQETALVAAGWIEPSKAKKGDK